MLGGEYCVFIGSKSFCLYCELEQGPTQVITCILKGKPIRF